MQFLQQFLALIDALNRHSVADLEAKVLEIEGVEVGVASPRTLYWMKRDTVRPIDQADAQRLADTFDLEEDP